jgi:hypothetical protein
MLHKAIVLFFAFKADSCRVHGVCSENQNARVHMSFRRSPKQEMYARYRLCVPLPSLNHTHSFPKRLRAWFDGLLACFALFSKNRHLQFLSKISAHIGP